MRRFPSETSVPLTHAEEKSLSKLHERSGRIAQGVFLAEGIRVLEEAFRHEKCPETLFVDAGGLDEREHEIRESFAKRGARIRPLPSKQIAKLSTVDQPQGLIGCFPLDRPSLTALKKPSRVLWCHTITDPGNMGTIFRSALAFGVDQVICSGKGVDPHHDKVIRASAGAVFGLTLVETGDADILAWCGTIRARLLALALRGKGWREVADSLLNPKKRSPLVIVVGNEAHGLPTLILDEATEIVRIEQDASVESLNAAVACSILLYETQQS